MQVEESTGQTRQESARSRHVSSILVAESLDQLLLFYTRADDHHRERRQSQESQEPVGGQQTQGEPPEENHIVERVPNPTIWTVGDQRMLAPGDDGIRQVLAQAVERPEEERRDCEHRE